MKHSSEHLGSIASFPRRSNSWFWSIGVTSSTRSSLSTPSVRRAGGDRSVKSGIRNKSTGGQEMEKQRERDMWEVDGGNRSRVAQMQKMVKMDRIYIYVYRCGQLRPVSVCRERGGRPKWVRQRLVSEHGEHNFTYSSSLRLIRPSTQPMIHTPQLFVRWRPARCRPTDRPTEVDASRSTRLNGVRKRGRQRTSRVSEVFRRRSTYFVLEVVFQRVDERRRARKERTADEDEH